MPHYPKRYYDSGSWDCLEYSDRASLILVLNVSRYAITSNDSGYFIGSSIWS